MIRLIILSLTLLTGCILVERPVELTEINLTGEWCVIYHEDNCETITDFEINQEPIDGEYIGELTFSSGASFNFSFKNPILTIEAGEHKPVLIRK